jgi:uncharacterized protein YecE (DUF72 family)
MNAIYAGTSGWSYATWKPSFYPAKLPSAKFLSYYATRLNTVEVNYTFRTFPKESTLAGWIAATPENFRFAVKAHQSITHSKRLRNANESVDRFAASIAPLQDAGKLGPVLFQLPPNFKCDATRLEDFLAALPGNIRAAFEFRHESWFCEQVFNLLRSANAALCIAESDDIETPDVQTAGFSYFRPRMGTYSPQARKTLAARVAGLAHKGDTFIFFKHEDSPEGALYAEELLQATAGKSKIELNGQKPENNKTQQAESK